MSAAVSLVISPSSCCILSVVGCQSLPGDLIPKLYSLLEPDRKPFCSGEAFANFEMLNPPTYGGGILFFFLQVRPAMLC